MHRKTSLTHNPWFLLPFLLWMIGGGILLATFNAEQLFAAVNTRHTSLLDSLMFYITFLGDGIPMAVILLLVCLIPGFRNWWFLLAAVLCNVVPALLTQILKEAFDAPRPMTVFKGETWLHMLTHWDMLYERSFPSGHTTGGFSLFCFLSLLLPRRWAWAGLLCFAMALLVGYSRMYLAAHFFRDVYAGSLIGTITALAMYRLERELHGRFFRVRKELGEGSAS